MNTIRALWRGQFSLPQTFWGFYIGGIFIVLISAGLLLAISNQYRLGTIGFIVGVIVVYGYGLIATVAVWQSARAYMASPIWVRRIWAVLARGLVCLWSAGVLWHLINGGALMLMERMTARMDF